MVRLLHPSEASPAHFEPLNGVGQSDGQNGSGQMQTATSDRIQVALDTKPHESKFASGWGVGPPDRWHQVCVCSAYDVTDPELQIMKRDAENRGGWLSWDNRDLVWYNWRDEQ